MLMARMAPTARQNAYLSLLKWGVLQSRVDALAFLKLFQSPQILSSGPHTLLSGSLKLVQVVQSPQSLASGSLLAWKRLDRGSPCHGSSPRFHFQTERGQFQKFQGLLPEGQGQNLVLSILCAPHSLEISVWLDRGSPWRG